jgi:SAM-dependent methyltransferase
MDQAAFERLLAINSQFYQTFADQFSATRQRLQPGVQRVLSQTHLEAHILDLGCGNGCVWPYLVSLGYHGRYIGLDSNAGLLEIARRRAAEQLIPGGEAPVYLQADLVSPDWERKIIQVDPDAFESGRFDLVTAFACLHHLPGENLHLQVLEQVHRLLAPKKRFVHSEWQLLNSPRLRARVQPWEAAGLRADQVDPGDVLIDWRAGGTGLRYVHCFSEAELSRLASQAGFSVVETFYSDGDGGRLGLYQVWESDR